MKPKFISLLHVEDRFNEVEAELEKKRKELAESSTVVTMLSFSVSEKKRYIDKMRRNHKAAIDERREQNEVATKIQARLRGKLARRRMETEEMLAKRKQLQERQMALLRDQMHSMYQSVHTMHYEEHKIECYTSIQRWFRGILRERQGCTSMVYRLCTRMWKRLVAACVAIQRNWLLRRSAK